jgi:hypothetical protein
MFVSSPPDYDQEVQWLGNLAVGFFVLHAALWMTVRDWPRPVEIRVATAREVLDEHLGPVVERRIESMLDWFGAVVLLAYLAFLLIAVL